MKYKDPEKKRQYHLEHTREWRKKNPEKYEARRKKNKQRRLKLRFQVLQRDNFTCQYCGRRPPECILEVDHKYPKAKGGLDKIENYITSCRECNLGKGDVILKEFS